jgi:hypothetical protein
MPAVKPLHSGPAQFEGGLTEVGPGVHASLQPNGALGESNAGLVIDAGASLPRRVPRTARRWTCTTCGSMSSATAS